ncbi:hypothetical protein TNCV_3690021 [Trichonephila clavipes]|uniref:Uncharacterized protein n=1 Tax=Trichonephila clavipes TaxID=2585209 RepID=A0A8X6VQA4_TRICX|nr:hypothetical protein TNCV_3690021 [Trichonephila clavipes]
MRDSSVKTTSFHSSTHILLSSHHWRRRRLWFCVKCRPSNGRLADRPLCCKRRQMEDFETHLDVKRPITLHYNALPRKPMHVKYVEAQISSRWCEQLQHYLKLFVEGLQKLPLFLESLERSQATSPESIQKARRSNGEKKEAGSHAHKTHKMVGCTHAYVSLYHLKLQSNPMKYTGVQTLSSRYVCGGGGGFAIALRDVKLRNERQHFVLKR